MSEKMPRVGRLTEYALFFGLLVGVAIMNVSVYQERNSEKLLGGSSGAPAAEQ